MQSNYFKIALITAVLLVPCKGTFAATVDELKNKIDSHSEQIKKLDEEIKIYQGQIEETGKQANTLQNAIKTLDTDQKKVTTEIKKTETTISKVNLTLDKLSQEIRTTEQKIETGREAIAVSLRGMRETDATSLVEIMLGKGSLMDVMGEYDKSMSFNDSVRAKTQELLGYKVEVEEKAEETKEQKGELVSLQGDLKGKNAVLTNTKKEKSTLLTQTKNQEATYKQVLAQKQAEKERVEKELFDFESQLKIAIDPTKYQAAKKGILSWPLENITVTQSFGRTADAKRLYVSGSHNGIDFRASRGTKVMSVLDGVVQGTGNTDAQKGCYSYGKWVLIKHPNGLTSLYAHLDVISVNAGQTVSEGATIGYSGASGYATGPHLHLTLYASQGVDVQRYSSSKNCKNVDIPVAPANAYLDPMPYFPPL